ncbi:DNA-binding transcriptional regulator, LysR family [Evansella caseinilytica]|uniref:DNA-binding transcriptional regulator, LysR family n=1 Tax=Evansella caseinilytica TaxID=1503961 RepID=A0A1H3QDV2_9BACI|nr:LysR family transcriptional regulator [Evansella caseinilytica]SDZ11470.1 DNA-binding transcriptional regulator, LysR family [Evansella caseinilytica]
MKVQDYELLVALKRAGTIRGAAESLLISQPAISQRLKQLENDWGTTLFIRTSKRLLITPAGEKIVSHADEILARERTLRNEIASDNDSLGGTLSLGVSSVVGQYFLPQVLGEFIKQYPQVNLRLTTGLSQDVQKSMAEYHIGIYRGERIGFQPCEHLFSDPLFLLDQKHVGESRFPRPLITFRGDEALQILIHKWILDHPAIRFSQAMKVDQIETCKQLMKFGVGMAVLPESAIRDLNDDYKATPLIYQGEPLARETWLTYSDDAEKLPQVQAFIAKIRQLKQESRLDKTI